MEPDIEVGFFGPQIDELPLHYIQDWYFAAHYPNGVAKSTWGYLLPRILEILASGDVSIVGIEINLAVLRQEIATIGPRTNGKLLINFNAFSLCVKPRTKTENYLDDTICMVRLAGRQLQNLLEQVASTPDVILAERLWNDWSHGVVPSRESVWMTAFWDDPDKTIAFDFYTSKTIYSRMETLVFVDDTAPEISTKALAVASVIEASASWNVSP